MIGATYRVSIFLLIAFLLLPACAGASSEGYIACISEALKAICQGLTQESFELLQEALAKNPGSKLAHVALGYTLLIGGRVDEANAEFDLASKDNKCALAVYGRGLISLKKGRLGEAASYFCLAQQMDPERDMRAAIEYVKAMARTNPGVGVSYLHDQVNEATDEAFSALLAVRLMSEGKYGEALSIWQKLQPGAVRTGFGERIGCSMTFLKERPLAVTGWPLKVRPIVEPAKALRTVKGTVRLQADLRRAKNVRMVTFLVDDKLIGITNRPPFDTTWDTTRWSNGRHTVKIVGTDENGVILSEKTTQVIVDNPISKKEISSALDEDPRGLWDVLWEQMRLKPSAAAINYNLAICALETGDVQTAKAALERTMAADPGYPGAAERLSRLCNPAPLKAVYKIDTSDKLVALTFDDGPKPDTAALLDVLKEKDVKATFFIVGKQAERYPELLKRICDEGHEIGNHSYNHYALEFLPVCEIERDIFKCQAVVRSITGREMRLLRPPGARVGKKVSTVARKYGIRIVMYSTNCSNVEGTTKDSVLHYALASVHPGAVLLMHNLDRVTLQALPELIDRLRARGYRFVTF